MSPAAPQSSHSVRTPLWRRITAVFSLGTIVILVGIVLAALVTLTALMMVFLVERAIA